MGSFGPLPNNISNVQFQNKQRNHCANTQKFNLSSYLAAVATDGVEASWQAEGWGGVGGIGGIGGFSATTTTTTTTTTTQEGARGGRSRILAA